MEANEEGQEAQQTKRITKVSAAVHGSIASYTLIYEAKEKATVQTSLTKFLKGAEVKQKHQSELAARFAEHT
jgi:hypothetical protein